jgi:hypothetical protein
MDGIELAIRRVSERLKSRTPWDMGVTQALDELADEIATISTGIPDPSPPRGGHE